MAEQPPQGEAGRQLVRAWLDAAAEPAVRDLLAQVHAELGAAVERVRPLCTASGRCCHFERYGHRLYVTGLEVAATVLALPPRRRPGVAAVQASVARGDCPFLERERCSIHAQRPLGCRLYFCDGRWSAQQDELTERLHRRIVQLHETWQVPYRYDEWRRQLTLFAEHA